MIKNLFTDNTWTLFLDRDGVLNQEKQGGYILNRQELIIMDGVKEAMQIFAAAFSRIIIITNQRGIGKGQMTADTLHDIHLHLQQQIQSAGGRIDAFFYCPDVEQNSPCRKPNTGMALQAKAQFPGIDFTKTIMVGNSLSDMEFGRNIHATTIFLTTTNQAVDRTDDRIDYFYDSLISFAKTLSIAPAV